MSFRIFPLLSTLFFAFIMASCQEEAEKAQLPALKTPVETAPPAEVVFGFSLDTFDLEKGTVGSGQFLADLLAPHVNPGQASTLAHSCKEVFDVRKIKAGKPYYKFCDKNNQALCGFVYQDNPIDYYVFSFTDSVPEVRHCRHEVSTQIKESSGIIEGSLWAVMTSKGDHPALAVELSEVFGWQVDFFTVQKGDCYKVIYEEHSVAGESIGIGKILGACFTHRGEDYYAIRFEKDHYTGYFDHEGKSLRKQFLKAPLKYSRISSKYTLRRLHPVQKIWKPHLGTDYAAAPGTPIRTVGDGVVEKSGYGAGNGNYVKVKHNATYATQYLHMSKIAPGMKAGKRVKQGEVIGYVGSTGLATGPHLCFRFWKNNKQVDPFSVKIPPAEPIDKKYEPVFFEVRDKIMSRLNNLITQESPQDIASSKPQPEGD